MASVYLDGKGGKRVTATATVADRYVQVDNGKQIDRYDYVGNEGSTRVYRHTDSSPKVGVPQT